MHLRNYPLILVGLIGLSISMLLDAQPTVAADAAKKRVVFVAGTRSHGYGAHEHYAGSLLLAKELEKAMPGFQCDVHRDGWPQEGLAAFEGADAVVVYCDGGNGHLLNRHIDEFNKVMDKGVGLACLHYGVEVPKGKSGDAFLNWIGGYFETHYSVNPHWTAKFAEYPAHPVTNGVGPIEINDEWYFHMRFRDGMAGVTPILSAVAPASTMSRPDGPHSGNPAVRKSVAANEPQHVAWVSERPSGGRGFGFTGGHYHWNWGDDNFRKVVLNAIVWIAKGEVPSDGVTTATPSRTDLEANQDFPKPAPKKKAKVQARLRSSARTAPVALTTDQPQDNSHAAENAVDNLDVHPELKTSLFAAEPMLLSPSNIDIDHRGRVWVCEIVNYRAHNGKRKEGDRILILEDTDGDGVADQQKVFYQGPEIDSPHGVCVLGNRVIVSANGKVISFTDIDGDDKPDKKEYMYTGIDGAQHDHGIHAFVFGPDGKLYFNFGNAGKQLLDADGKPVVDLAGNVVNDHRQPYQEGMVFRVNPDGTGLETLGWNFRNNWMVTVDSFGTLWQSDNDDDGNRGVRINFVMEFGNYGYKDEFTGAGWREPRTGMSELPQQHWHQNDPGVVPNLLHTGAGSPTGITVYEGGMMPQSLRGQLIHCDAGPSVTRAYIVSEDGAGYRAEIANILEGTRDQWFRPSDVKVAPDGSLIVADWYDPGVGGHRMGDLDRGRIFRVVPKNHDGSYEVPRFDFSTAAGAVAALRSPNYSVRYMAWTSLHDMGEGAEAELLKAWKDPDPRQRARALWLLGKIPGKGQQYVDLASQDANADLRIVSLRLARQLADVDEIKVVSRLVHDSSSKVRRECAIALRHNKSDEAATLWAELAGQHDGQDRWYLEALGIAADQQWDRFLAAWLKSSAGQLDTAAARDLIWRSRGSRSPEWVTKLIEIEQDPAALARYFRAVDFFDGEAKRKTATELALSGQTGGDARGHLIALESIRRLEPGSVKGNSEFRSVLDLALDQTSGSEFVNVVGRFDVEQRYPELLAMAQDAPGSQAGVEAIMTLLAKAQQPLIEAAMSDSENAAPTIEALGNAADSRAVELLQALVREDGQDLELRRLAVRSMAKIRQGASRLLRAVEADRLDQALRPAAAAELTRSRWQDLRAKALKLFPLPASKEAEPIPPISELVEVDGDPAAGRLVFQQAGTCAKCHIVGREGKEVGPNLSEIGSKLSREAMFESILYPSAGISHNYESYTVVTQDGNTVTGLLTSQTDDSVTITSDDGIARTFERSDVEAVKQLKVSLMPAELLKLMTQDELVNVVAYLSTLKKE